MKNIVAIIKHFKFDDVKKALTDAGIQGMTVIDVKGFGRQKGHAELYGGADHGANFLPKIKIEFAVPDGKVEEVIKIITESANSGEIGDGKIFVYDLQDAVRIRTGEKEDKAIS